MITLNTSWINGNYVIEDCWSVSINSSLSFVCFEALPNSSVNDFTFQGDEADDVILQIFDIWNNGDMTQHEAVAQWANMMLH